MYRSAPHLREFHERVTRAAGSLTADYEIVYVNDGSPDGSLEVALELQAQDAHVTVVDLSRNFGHHPAIMTGLRHAAGELMFLIDCDLQEDPELLGRFEAHRVASRADVVFGVQDSRGSGWFDRLSAKVFYKLFNLLSTDRLPENLMTVRLMTRRYVNALLQHGETEMTIACLWARTGFRQQGLPVRKRRRRGTTYTLRRRVALFVQAVTAFSGKPLVAIFHLGCMVIALSLAAASWLVVRQLIQGVPNSGWPSLMVSMWLLGGLILFSQGVLGIYLSKVFLEVKRRPLTIVRHVHHRSVEEQHESIKRAG
jgi:putative glycosyltransferase